MRWSVALFGYHKPRFYLQDKVTGLNVSTHVEEPMGFDEDRFELHYVVGWEKRAEPGDVIAFRPVEDEWKWTPRERSSFLIVTIDGPTLEQMGAGLIEPYWDLNSHPEYNPPSFEEFAGPLDAYEEFLDHARFHCAYPKEYLKKRRFHIPIPDLLDIGVDLEQMLDKEALYSPKGIDFKHTEACFDKMKKRKVVKEDRLRMIDRREVG